MDARYNFALTLKAAGYVTDAVNELNKILASNPDEARIHLALGNIYAQQMYDPVDARQHYLKVLQLDPRNPRRRTSNSGFRRIRPMKAARTGRARPRGQADKLRANRLLTLENPQKLA